MFAFCCHLERLHDISTHPRDHEGLYKRPSEPVRPLQSNRRRQPVAHAFPLGNEFVHETRIVTSLELDEVDARYGDVTQDVHDFPLDVINLDHRRVSLPANDPRTSDRRGKEARPIVRILIERPDAIGRRVHVLADDGEDHV